MTDASLLLDRRGAVVVATINRPAALNALDASVFAELRSLVDHVRRDGSIRAVVITGAGEKAFSAGADLKEVQAMGPDEARAMIEGGQEVFAQIAASDVPFIAAVNGLALGGGFELILSCAFPILSTKAALGLPESSLGLIPGYGGTQRLPLVTGGPVASHLMLTGARLKAARAYALGLTPVEPVAPEALLDEAVAVAETVAAQGPYAVRAILQALRTGAADPTGLGLEAGLAVRAISGAESAEGVGAFLERRPAQFADRETV